MKHYILCGEFPVNSLHNKQWKLLKKQITEDFNGEIICFDDSDIEKQLFKLINSLRGWNNFKSLSRYDINEIEKNTKILIL